MAACVSPDALTPWVRPGAKVVFCGALHSWWSPRVCALRSALSTGELPNCWLHSCSAHGTRTEVVLVRPAARIPTRHSSRRGQAECCLPRERWSSARPRQGPRRCGMGGTSCTRTRAHVRARLRAAPAPGGRRCAAAAAAGAAGGTRSNRRLPPARETTERRSPGRAVALSMALRAGSRARGRSRAGPRSRRGARVARVVTPYESSLSHGVVNCPPVTPAGCGQARARRTGGRAQTVF
eukprot:scaffold916_cov516-Prasinococcus_capsulatus_cf.AAC.33